MNSVGIPSRAMLEAAHALKTSRPAGRALIVGSGDCAQWARTEFASMVLCEIDAPGSEQSYDLIVVTEDLEIGSLADALERLGRFKSQLAKDGLGLFRIQPMVHPLLVEDGPTPVGPFDALLFPHAAKMGDLGKTAQQRLMLSPLSWRYMFERAGFSVLEASGGQPDGREADLRRAHGSRLVHFDDEALSSSALTFLVSAAGGSQ